MNGKPTKALFDTGAYVSIVSQCWLVKNLPKANLQNILEILDAELDSKAANGTNIPYVGWVAINFAMASDDAHVNISVPFLVTSPNINKPIVGYSVIEEAIKHNAAASTNLANTRFVKSMIATFHKTNTGNIPSFIDFLYKNATNNNDLRALKTNRVTEIVPKGEAVNVHYRANVGMIRYKILLLFESDLSTSISNDLELAQRLLVLPKAKSPPVSI